MTDPRIDPRPVTISRRRLLQGSILAGVGAFLAACSPNGRDSPPVGSAGPSTTVPPAAGSSDAVGPSPGGELRFANWLTYIDLTFDPGPDGQQGGPDDGYALPSPTLDQFTAETGIEVRYEEVIRTNQDFFETDLADPLSQGKPTGWDLIVMTDWMASRLIRLGWVETIDTTGMHNFPTNLDPIYRDRPFDPGPGMTAPWQSGMTGLGFDTTKTGRLDSLDALWDDRFKGKVDYLDEMRDSVGLAALRLGFDPATITDDQFMAALAEVDTALRRKIARPIKQGDFIFDLDSGDAVLAMCYSGDIYQLRSTRKEISFVVAKEGGMLWTDNMMIPKGAENRRNAEAFIDFYYDPAIAAQVADFVAFVCPVTGAQEALRAIDPVAADDPLIFPPAEVLGRLHVFRELDEATETKYTKAWTTIVGE